MLFTYKDLCSFGEAAEGWYLHVYVVTGQKAEIVFTLYCCVVEPTSVQQINFNLEGNFFSEIVRVASSTRACELTE